jgi:hypothetical protein
MFSTDSTEQMPELFATSSRRPRYANLRALFVPLARLAYLSAGTWMIFAIDQWTTDLAVPLLACFLPTILHLTLSLPHSRPLVANRPYLLRWIYGLPLLGLLAYILLWSVAPVMGAREGNNMGFMLAKMFEELPLDSRNNIALAGFTVAAILLSYSGWNWKRRGWREAFLRRPASTIVTLLVAPVGTAVAITQACSLLNLPSPILNAGAFAVEATLYTQFIAARSTTLVLFPIAACVILLRGFGGPKWLSQS